MRANPTLSTIQQIREFIKNKKNTTIYEIFQNISLQYKTIQASINFLEKIGDVKRIKAGKRYYIQYTGEVADDE